MYTDFLVECGSRTTVCVQYQSPARQSLWAKTFVQCSKNSKTASTKGKGHVLTLAALVLARWKKNGLVFPRRLLHNRLDKETFILFFLQETSGKKQQQQRSVRGVIFMTLPDGKQKLCCNNSRKTRSLFTSSTLVGAWIHVLCHYLM